MTELLPQRVRTRRAFEGRLVKVDVDTVRDPRGREADMEIVRHPGAVAVVPLLSEPDSPDPAILLIEQYRHAAGGSIWEIPAGTLEPGEDPAACARRELLEETGASATELEPLTTVYTTPGFTDERIHLFLGTGLTLGEPDREGDEFIKVRPLALTRVLEMIRDGEIADAKTIAGVLWVAGFRLSL
jgi:ADP-ribose pyrophosphatase